MSFQALYDKVRGIETQVVRKLVSGSAARLVPVVQKLKGECFMRMRSSLLAAGVALITVANPAAAQTEPRVDPSAAQRQVSELDEVIVMARCKEEFHSGRAADRECGDVRAD